MAGLKTFALAFAIFGLVSAAPTIVETHRVNDLVVLDGTTLRFDPVNGFDDTTREPEWQLQYLENLLDYKTKPQVTERSEAEVAGRDKLVERQELSAGAICFRCVVDTLMCVNGGLWCTREYVMGICDWACAGFTLAHMSSYAAPYARELGWSWENNPQTENKYIWQHTPSK